MTVATRAFLDRPPKGDCYSARFLVSHHEKTLSGREVSCRSCRRIGCDRQIPSCLRKYVARLCLALGTVV